MCNSKMTPQLRTYYEVRYDILIQELRQIAEMLGRPNPVPTKRERQRLQQPYSPAVVDVMGAK